MADEEKTPDLYCNSVTMRATPYEVILGINRMKPDAQKPEDTETLAFVRMAHAHAKVLAIMLRKNLRNVEAKLGTQITIDVDLMKELGISKEEDW